jgi:adenylate cyclase
MDPGSIRPARVSLVIGLIVFALVALAWQAGWFQSSELWVYDRFLNARSDPKATDPRFVFIAQTEQDIAALDFPLRDSVLSQLLEKVESGGAAVIGLDLYRDLPEPRAGTELPLLNKTLLAHDNITTIFRLGDPEKPFLIPPPACLQGAPDRFGFNDFPYDYKSVRRAFLYARIGKTTYNSFAWSLALEYLANQGIQASSENHRIRLGKTVIDRFQGDDGGYMGAASGGYQFLIDFRGPRDFVGMSVHEALGLKDPGIFHDKIVLIGSKGESLNDEYETPVSNGMTPGTVIHAQIINQLLRAALDGDRPTETASTVFRWFSLLFWCAAGIIAGFFVRSHLLFALTIVAGSALILGLAWWMFLAGYWTLTVAPLAGFFLTSIFVKGYAASHQEEEKAAVMKLFAQRVSPEVAQEIWSQRALFLQGGRPAAKNLTISALFTDLKNYSTISEKMSPTELIAWVNECTSALAQHVRRNGGTVNTYMGDGMMAVFGFPVPRSTEEEMKRDATNAVRCALSMAEEIKTMNARWKTEGKPLAGLRIGIFTGQAMSGMIGTEDHLEYSVIGDTVNTASRLESVDKEGEWTGNTGECRILIGELTHRYIDGIFPSRYVGEINLKGKQETTKVYKVLDHEDITTETKTTHHENAARPA